MASTVWLNEVRPAFHLFVFPNNFGALQNFPDSFTASVELFLVAGSIKKIAFLGKSAGAGRARPGGARRPC